MFKKYNEFFLKTRLKEGFTQKQFAEKLSISRSTVAKIESNRQDISKKTIDKLSEVFPDSFNSIQKENNNTGMESFEDGSKANWKSETIVKKDLFLFKVIDVYKKDIDTIEYFKNKIYVSLHILEKLGGEPNPNFVSLKEILEKNLADIKEIYSYFLVGSITREELKSNKKFLDRKQAKKLHDILNGESSGQWEKSSDELIMQSKNLLELFKNCFDDIFELIKIYAEKK